MALKSPTSAFEAYVDKYPGLSAKFASGTTGMTKAGYGSHHWKTHGRKETGRISPASLRSSDEGSPVSSAFTAAMGGISVADYEAGRRPSRSSSTEAWKTRTSGSVGEYSLAASGTTDPNEWQQHVDNTGQFQTWQPGASYAWTLRGQLEDYKFRNAATGTKRVLMEVQGEMGYAYLQNPEEEDKSKQLWNWQTNYEGAEGSLDSQVPNIKNLKIYEQGEGTEGTDPADDTYAMDDAKTNIKAVLPLPDAPTWESAFADLLADLTSILNKPATTATGVESTPMYGLEDTRIVKRPLDDASLKTSALTMVGARQPAGGMQVVDPTTGTVYANPGAARAAGITSWVYKYKYDAISTGTSTYSSMVAA